MNTFLSVVRWMFGIFMILLSLIFVFGSAMAGLMMFIAGLINLPPIAAKLHLRGLVAAAVGCVLFIASFVVFAKVYEGAGNRSSLSIDVASAEPAPVQTRVQKPAAQIAEVSTPAPTPKATATPPPVHEETMSARELIEAYDENEVAADRDYKGKRIVFTGKINSIDKDLFGSPFVVIGGSEHGMGLDGLRCEFSRSSVEELATLKKGQKIKIRGTVKGKMMFVIAASCEVVEK